MLALERIMSTFTPRSDASSGGGRSPASAHPGDSPTSSATGSARPSPAAAYAASRSERRKPRSVEDITANMKSHADELMAKANADGLFDAIKDPRELRQRPPSVAELHALYGTEVIVGVWRRTRYELGAFPLALTGKFCAKTVSTESFESVGSAWRFAARRAPDGEKERADAIVARLECVEVGRKPLVLEADLTLSGVKGGGADWVIAPAEPFRGDPSDLPVTISAPDGRRLCSDPATRKCLLVDARDVDARDGEGNFYYNAAWECSLMSAQRDDDPSLAFLDEYMAGDMDEATSQGLAGLEEKLKGTFPQGGF